MAINIGSVVNVGVDWAPIAAATRNFGALLIVGTAGVLSDNELVRSYTSLSALEQDFNQSTSEYQAAQIFFSQNPQPSIVYVGAWQSTETPTQCVSRLRQGTNAWYAVFFAVTEKSALTSAQINNISNFIEGCATPSLFLVNTQDDAVPSGSTTDVASTLPNNRRTIVMYSGQSAFAVCGLFGLFATVDYSGSNTIITAFGKQLQGVTADNLTDAQAKYLTQKKVNYYSQYNIGTAFVANGVTCYTPSTSGTTVNNASYYIDTVIGADALQNAIQVKVANFFMENNTVPYDPSGIALLKGQILQVCKQFVTNGWIARGQTWKLGSVGSLKTGSVLSQGYYLYFNKLSSVSQATIEARQAPPATLCVNVAGSIQSVTIDVYLGGSV